VDTTSCQRQSNGHIYHQHQQHLFNGPLSGSTWMSRYQKGKTNLDLLEQETVSGSGISLAICKSAPHPRQIIMPAFFTGRMPFLQPNQPHQSAWRQRHWRRLSFSNSV